LINRALPFENIGWEEKEMPQPNTMAMKGQTARSKSSSLSRLAADCWLITYIAAVSPLLLLIVLARLYPGVNRTDIPDWRPLISLADEASSSGDQERARYFYLQVDRVAYWQKDWEGLVAAACRINKLDGGNRLSRKVVSILLRAATTAELARSRHGIATVAKSLTALGSNEAASAVMARIEPNWPTEAMAFEDAALVQGCYR
jgi:hypothetical protein